MKTVLTILLTLVAVWVFEWQMIGRYFHASIFISSLFMISPILEHDCPHDDRGFSVSGGRIHGIKYTCHHYQTVIGVGLPAVAATTTAP